MAVEVSRIYKDRACALLARTWGMLVGGRIVQAEGGETYEAHSPADGRLLANVPSAQAEDVDRAVEAARTAFPSWRRTPATERAAMMGRAIEILRDNAEDLAVMDAVDSGNPVTAMVGDVHLACRDLEYMRGAAMEVKGQTIPSQTGDWLLTRREPYGVVGRITAFNHSLMFPAAKMGAPLMTGNTLILKVPHQVPLAPLLMGELLKDVFPPGVLNIITGEGRTAGEALVRHPDVKRLALIGGTGTGQRIQISAAEAAVKHVSLELGGKNPMIVFPDADLDAAAAAAVRGMNFQKTQGQSCGSTTRLFLHELVHDEVLEKVVALTRKIRMGHPLDPETEMGCIVSERQYRSVTAYIEAGKEDGAQLVHGGGRPKGEMFENGFFVEPTIFDGVTMGMRIAREEIFGPVLSVLTWRDKEDVVEQANALEFGLTGAVWTRDLQTAIEVADRLETGYVWINGSAAHFLGAPFSGHKNSGTDAEESIEELYSYTQVKTVNIGLS